MSEIWISEPDMRDLIGKEAAEAVMNGLAGRTFYIPRAPRADHPIAQYAGLRELGILCHLFGGERIALPSRRAGAHKHSISKLLAEGYTPLDIACRLMVTERYVRMIAAAVKNQAAMPAGPKQLSLL